MDKTNLKKKRAPELRQIAKDMGVENPDSLDRTELIEAILEVQRGVNPPTGGTGEAPKDPETQVEEKKEEEVKEEEAKQDDAENKEQESSFLVEGSVFEERKPAVGSKAETMKQILMAQPKVMFTIPLEEGEKMGATRSVTLNGYRLNIMKGVYVKLPMQIAETLMRSQRMTNEAINNFFLMDEQGFSPAMREKLQGPAPTVGRG